MQQDDFTRFRDVMAGMGRVFGAQVDSVILDVYWLALREWTIGEFEGAAAHLLQTAQFMPKPADFTALRKQAGEQTCGEAWAQVRAVLPNVNRYEPTSISPRIDHVVRAMGGYLALSMTETENLPFRENRFRELWEELGEADEARAALPFVAARLNGPQSSQALLGRIRTTATTPEAPC